MKKALIELNLQYHTTEDFAQALRLVKFTLDNNFPMDDIANSYCKAVFSDVIDLLQFYYDVCDDVGYDS